MLDLVRDVIDEMLVADLDAPRKQRHTAKRVFDRLVTEDDARVSYSYMAKYVHGWARSVGGGAEPAGGGGVRAADPPTGCEDVIRSSA